MSFEPDGGDGDDLGSALKLKVFAALVARAQLLELRVDASRVHDRADPSVLGEVSLRLSDGAWLERCQGLFLLEDAVPFSGDAVWTICRWTNPDGELAALKGKKIRLRFCLNAAKVFAYRFV